MAGDSTARTVTPFAPGLYAGKSINVSGTPGAHMGDSAKRPLIRRWSVIEVTDGPDRLEQAKRELIRHCPLVRNHETRDHRGTRSWGRKAVRAAA